MNTPEFFRSFAEGNRFKITIDPCKDPIIKGLYGNIYVYSEKEEKVGVYLLD